MLAAPALLLQLTLLAAIGATASKEGDLQIAWLGGGRWRGAEWLATRPEWRESGRVVSGKLWGLDSEGGVVFEVLGLGLGKRFGHRIARIGDVDADGCPDFVVSSFGGEWQEAREVESFGALRIRPMPVVQHVGSVRCCSGRDGRTLWVVWSRSPGDRFGDVAGAAGDFDGDGACDVAVGRAPADGTAPDLSRPRDGFERVEILSGVDGRLIHVLVSTGSRAREGFGSALAGGSDLDGDGSPELAIAAPYSVTSPALGWGRIDVFSARDLALRDRMLAPFEPTFERFGGPLGLSIDFVPDLDADGADELLATTFWGGVVLFEDASSSRRTPLELSVLSEDWSLTNGLGTTFAVVGDADQDERVDLLLGCRDDWPDTATRRTHATLLSGCDGRELAFLVPIGPQTCVAGARAAPWDALLGFPAQERAFLLREPAWRNACGSVTLEQLGALELVLE